jgi:hypothetical protein
MNLFTTPGGTKLPLLSLKDKPYLQVAHRIVWFREEHPDWTIETTPAELTKTSAIYRATIKNVEGRIIAMATKSETEQNFADFIEKAETGSIGRALAMCGYGTQFTADELNEGERIVDSPIDAAIPDNKPKPTTDIAPICPVHNIKMKWKSGISKTGKDYAFWGCTKKDSGGWCKQTINAKEAEARAQELAKPTETAVIEEINIDEIPF